MPFDYKKEYKEFYLPKKTPALIEVPPINYIAVKGEGDPNTEGGEYKLSIGMLYTTAFTIKMSKRAGHDIDGFFDYVVPPLEGFWTNKDGSPIGRLDSESKKDLKFISVIRLPDFVNDAVFNWAINEARSKKGVDLSKVEFLTVNEGLCVQCMHIGSYDSEPETLALIHKFMRENGLTADYSEGRLHHEIYLSDPRRAAPEKLRTVLRLPVKRG